MLKTRAAVLNHLNAPLSITEIDVPRNLLPGQVLVKVITTAICGSQLGEIAGIKGPDRFLPHLLGHEAVVEILNQGDSNFLLKGDIALAHWMRGYGLSGGPVSYTSGRKTINAGEIATFSEIAVISENRLTPIPKDLITEFGWNFLSTVGCAFLTAYGTLLNDIGLQRLDKVLLIGGGGVSQALTVMLKSMGKNAISVIEPNLIRREYIKTLGASETYTGSEELDRSQNAFTAAIDLTGIPKEIELAFESICETGVLALIGVTKANEKISINPMPLHYGKRIVGVFGGRVKPERDIFKILQFARLNKDLLSKMKYTEVSLNDVNEGINLMRNSLIAGRVVIKMDS